MICFMNIMCLLCPIFYTNTDNEAWLLDMTLFFFRHFDPLLIFCDPLWLYFSGGGNGCNKRLGVTVDGVIGRFSYFLLPQGGSMRNLILNTIELYFDLDE